jgi:beta-galactosidase/beta-glucuronidase
MVDNGLSVPRQILSSSHAYPESTQTNWNGIIGDLKIEAMSAFHIKDVQVYPDAKAKSANVKVYLNRPLGNKESPEITIYAEACNTKFKHRVGLTQHVDSQNDTIEVLLEFGEDAVLWDEFCPAYYSLYVSIIGKGISDISKTTFGLRDFYVNGTQFKINNYTTFLRGKHDACVFPLTGHVAMDVDSWRNYFM